ncbi:PrsW family intramembrane metalloprotease [Caloramator sp. E03]|uniref:PrsW family glutamic-type intramembrane protease n=1 Tax=Caloramator sp. E03 TaxID=2576307 RepID=UPI00111070CB|nr:PrsW family glutamic-type intramembrane protease [Caloramator sp. E03]QCX32319.1 PrsW family intramembrane metalloprotease [Caloramator sp. E03]
MFKMIALALAPSIALLVFIYQKDRYDREPAPLLTKLFIYGILSVFPVYIIERFLSGLSNYDNAFFQAFIVAGLTEEYFKYYIILKTAFNNKFYNEKLDGIVYSVFTSLGFATAENILYVFNVKANYLYTGIARALLSVPAHMLFAITMGYYISLYKYSKYKSEYIYKALFIPVILHGIYDYILFSRIYNYFVLLIVFVIYLWYINLSKLNKYVLESKNRE